MVGGFLFFQGMLRQDGEAAVFLLPGEHQGHHPGFPRQKSAPGLVQPVLADPILVIGQGDVGAVVPFLEARKDIRLRVMLIVKKVEKALQKRGLRQENRDIQLL